MMKKKNNAVDFLSKSLAWRDRERGVEPRMTCRAYMYAYRLFERRGFSWQASLALLGSVFSHARFTGKLKRKLCFRSNQSVYFHSLLHYTILFHQSFFLDYY